MNNNTLAPPEEQSHVPFGEVFLRRWAKERGLDLDWFAHSAGSGFSPHFTFINHDGDGQPRTDLSTERHDRKEGRYISPRGKGSVIYAPLPDSWAKWAASRTKYLAEGEGKTIALAGRGYPSLGFRGCDGWHLGGTRALHPDLARHIRPGDEVVFCMDADWHTNILVHRAAFNLMTALRKLSVRPLMIDFAALPDMPNAGIDDLMAEWERTGENVHARLAMLPRLEKIPNPFTVDAGQPLNTAQSFLDSDYADRSLARWQGQFYRWNGRGWQPVAEEVLRSELYEFFADNGAHPKAATISNAMDALRARAQLDRAEPNGEFFSCGNGLLDLGTGELLPHSPEYFNLNWSDVECVPGADCPRWRAFLEQVYPADPEAQSLLQEWMGYCLTDDTSQQKMLMMVGAKRSGKGTIARVMSALAGAASFASPTLGGLGERFGLANLIGKKVAVISDARMSSRRDQQAVVENMLRISGEDFIEVDRKHIAPWNGRLRARLWVISNSLPGLLDDGGAFASRFLVLHHRVTFFGKEDTRLEGALLAELPGILNWARAGLLRLRERGSFVQPHSGLEQLDALEMMNSPVKAFVRDYCELRAGALADKNDLYLEFRLWCDREGKTFTQDKARFGNSLLAATDHKVRAVRRKVDGRDKRVYEGIKLVRRGVNG